MARIMDLEDQIFARAAAVVDAFLSFHEVRPGQEEPPPEWIRRYGEEGARQRLEVAKAGWMPTSLAPAAARLSPHVMAGISRGRKYNAQIKAEQLNVQVISLPAPTSAASPNAPKPYPVREIE